MKIYKCVLPLTFSLLASTAVIADQVFLEDVIVDGSLCVGTPCVDGEYFGFDTLKIKSATPSIMFEDTSISSAFPTSDWRMSVADNQNNISIFSITHMDNDEPVLQLSAHSAGGAAIGAGSVLMDGAVSFGSVGMERRVSHVAEGVDETDAVTLSQLQSLEVSLAPELSGLEGELSSLSNRIDALVALLNTSNN